MNVEVYSIEIIMACDNGQVHTFIVTGIAVLHTCTCICTCICTCVCACIYIYTCVYMYIHVYIYIYIYMFMYTCICTCICTYMCVYNYNVHTFIYLRVLGRYYISIHAVGPSLSLVN